MEFAGYILILVAMAIITGSYYVKKIDGATPITAFLDKVDDRVYLYVSLISGLSGVGLILLHIFLGW